MEFRTAKGRLFFFMLLIIFLPLLQHVFGFIESGKLDGAMTLHPDIKFTPSAWWSGSYQDEKMLFINDSTGFRPDLVRLTNEINYRVFKLLPSVAYVGNNGYLFNREYIDEHEGRYYTDDVAIRSSLIKLKLVQDTLERMGKTFVFAYAPSKAYFMPENIPFPLRRPGGPKTSNYQAFRKLGDSLKIKQLDYNALFAAMRDTSKNLLFTRLGAHWSTYGSLLASDTLIKFIEHERNIKMPHLVITKLRYPDTIMGPDNDLAKCSNLIFPLAKEKLCYPEYHYSTDNTKIKMIVIGDSFGGQWITNEFLQNVTTHWEYWYYFNVVWDKDNIFNDAITIDKYDWQKSVLDANCIVVIYNPTNLQGQTTPTAFIERMYAWLYPDKK
jgi:acetyltransferase AlgX (SGNH hydrolase-like protein)